MDQWLLAVTSDPAAKGSAKDLEVAGAGPVHCRFSIPPSFLTMCSSERCLSLASPWYIDHLNQIAHSLYRCTMYCTYTANNIKLVAKVGIVQLLPIEVAA